ncbi:glycosyltransferase [Pseudomonas sp. QE6]|uniref:glycosyltransferase n=1 Tax=Pseudomonas sp. QE6 TaxID=3242491 RepID=UPI003526E74F
MTMTIFVRNRAGDSDYSIVPNGPGPGLSFLYQNLLAVLNGLGDVVEVAAGADLHRFCQDVRADGNKPVYCVFGLPGEADTPECCPVIAAIAWPFEILPSDFDPAWRERLLLCAGVITFSQQSAQAIRHLMGEDFPVLVTPAQPWERFAVLCPAEGALPLLSPRTLRFTGQLLDSPSIGLSVDALARPEPAAEESPVIEELLARTQAEPARLNWRQRLQVSSALARGWWREMTDADGHRNRAPVVVEAKLEVEPEPVMEAAHVETLPALPQRITLHGVVYTCVLRAEDETRNWTEMLTAFCLTFRDEPDATLVFKFTHANLSSGRIAMLTNLSRLSPFRCRVVVINGYLDEPEYAQLIAASHYLVHPALSESSAVTVQEFLSAGRPVLAPRHSALGDWLEEDYPLLFQCSRQPTHWAGDPDKRMRFFDHRLNWQSMCAVFQASFDLAVSRPMEYQALSAGARTGMQVRASMNLLLAQWREFFSRVCREPVASRPLGRVLGART